jgi:hypothetical protein
MEPQRRLNNVMKEIVKKEVLKLLHVDIIYLVPNSEWVSPVQVVLTKEIKYQLIKGKKTEGSRSYGSNSSHKFVIGFFFAASIITACDCRDVSCTL